MPRVISQAYRCKLSVPVVENSVGSRRIAVTDMQQIADWLKKLGMSEYAERFARNGIEIATLPELTDHDLESLGVSLGHRRRILRAIRELGGPAQAAPQTAAAPDPHDRAERRQLTVMFCDLVGSTGLA